MLDRFKAKNACSYAALNKKKEGTCHDGREWVWQRASPVSSVKATSLHLSVPQFTSYKMTDKRNSEGFGSFETL